VAVEPIDSERYPHIIIDVASHDYRVGFWWHPAPEPGSDTPPERIGWGVQWWDVTAEDVHEVIAWADAKTRADADFELYTLLVWTRDETESDILVKLAGFDPTWVETGGDGFFRRHPL
jgi:hypothetical protein